MPERDSSPANAVLEALGFVLFVRGADGTLRLNGAQPPAWLLQLWPVLATQRELPIADASPFLENFLIDAEECWREGGNRRCQSGPWVEQGTDGAEVHLEATALTAGAQSVLLIEQLGEVYEAKKSMLQKARETVIAYQRLNSEIQKKEILLHCLAEDMSAALANVITSLRLIELENNAPKITQLLGLASRAAEEQQTLINRILSVFARELDDLYGHGDVEPQQKTADLRAVMRRAVESIASQFAEKNVRLNQPEDTDGELNIAANGDLIQRVIGNLLETALERTPAGGNVSISLAADSESAQLNIEDTGAELPPRVRQNLFAKFEQPSAGSETVALRLHFCRMIVENCGGEVGCAAGANGGNRFWIRLPGIAAPR